MNERHVEDAALFIGRMSADVSPADLRDKFSYYGQIKRCEVKRGGYGFVEYYHSDDATKALSEDGAFFCGSKIAVQYAKARKAAPGSEGCFRCGDVGHWSRNCPIRSEDRGMGYLPISRSSRGEGHRGRSYSRSRSRSLSSYRSRSRSRSPYRSRRRSRSGSRRRQSSRSRGYVRSRRRSPSYSRSRSPPRRRSRGRTRDRVFAAPRSTSTPENRNERVSQERSPSSSPPPRHSAGLTNQHNDDNGSDVLKRDLSPDGGEPRLHLEIGDDQIKSHDNHSNDESDRNELDNPPAVD